MYAHTHTAAAIAKTASILAGNYSSWWYSKTRTQSLFPSTLVFVRWRPTQHTTHFDTVYSSRAFFGHSFRFLTPYQHISSFGFASVKYYIRALRVVYARLCSTNLMCIWLATLKHDQHKIQILKATWTQSMSTDGRRRGKFGKFKKTSILVLCHFVQWKRMLVGGPSCAFRWFLSASLFSESSDDTASEWWL